MMIEVEPAHGFVLLTTLVMNLQCSIEGYVSGSQRKRFKVPYPDMGNGIHAKKLTDDQWTEFNNYQRAHYNYLEDISMISNATILAGIKFPVVSTGLGVGYIIGRYFYARGYPKSTKNGNGRTFGVVILDLCKIVMIGTATYSALLLANVL